MHGKLGTNSSVPWYLAMGQSPQEFQATSFPGFLSKRFQHLSLGEDPFHFEILPHCPSLPQNNTTELKNIVSLNIF